MKDLINLKENSIEISYKLFKPINGKRFIERMNSKGKWGKIEKITPDTTLEEFKQIVNSFNTGDYKQLYITLNEHDLNATSKGNDFVKNIDKILIDIDREKKEDGNATEEELEQAKTIAYAIYNDLKNKYGFVNMFMACSGNGIHIIVPVEFVADKETKDKIKDFLKILNAKYADILTGYKIDTSVSSAGNLTKLYGSKARKYEPTESRPHRLTYYIEAPENFEDFAKLEKNTLEVFNSFLEANGNLKSTKEVRESKNNNNNTNAQHSTYRIYVNNAGMQLNFEDYSNLKNKSGYIEHYPSAIKKLNNEEDIKHFENYLSKSAFNECLRENGDVVFDRERTMLFVNKGLDFGLDIYTINNIMMLKELDFLDFETGETIHSTLNDLFKNKQEGYALVDCFKNLCNSSRQNLIGCESVELESTLANDEPLPLEDITLEDCGIFGKLAKNLSCYKNAKIEPRKYLMQDFMAHGRFITFIYAMGGGGKTNLATLLARCLVKKQPFLGKEASNIDFNPLILSLEEDEEDIAIRFNECNKHLNTAVFDIEPDIIDLSKTRFEILKNTSNGIEAGKDFRELENYVRLNGNNVLIIDNLAMLGINDENARNTSATFGKLWNRFARNCNCHVIVLAHTNKSGDYSGSSTWAGISRQMYILNTIAKNTYEINLAKTNLCEAGQSLYYEWKDKYFYSAITEEEALARKNEATQKKKDEVKAKESQIKIVAIETARNLLIEMLAEKEKLTFTEIKDNLIVADFKKQDLVELLKENIFIKKNERKKGATVGKDYYYLADTI